MLASASVRRDVEPTVSSAPALAALLVDERDCDIQGVALPRPEVHLVVRFGPSAHSGLDVHAFGARQRVHRKLIRRGQRAVTARLHLGAQEAVLGVTAPAMSGRIVPLADLWGDASARRLFDRLANARDSLGAATILQQAITERVDSARRLNDRAQLALRAAERLAFTSVNAVADELGVSERHLRRIFQETVGMNPKLYAQLSRFRRALRAARGARPPNWASIAISAGYYDQAHLIADFRAISGVTPRALLDELRTAMSVG